MALLREPSIVLCLSSYPLRHCGIATYTQDLVHALTRWFNESMQVKVCALEEGDQSFDYPAEVIETLDVTNHSAYLRLAEQLNDDDRISSVWIQHEFGLFGGPYGDYLLSFLSEFKKQVVVTFHTVLPNPEPAREAVIQSIAVAVDTITVMTEHAKRILVSQYNISPDKITIIPHGTHAMRWRDKDQIKAQYEVQDRLILSTFGLLGPNKSIETALYALPSIVREFPQVRYFILGRTHPVLFSREGESYRRSLEDIIDTLGLQDHVRFVNRYLDLDELLDFLRLTDVYLFTSKDPDQAVSGTFSYAMSCGCPIVSTRIPHAVEMLNHDTRHLIDFNNPVQLAEATIRLLANKDQREQIGLRAFEQTRATAWHNVALSHAKLIARVTGVERFKCTYPPISMQHLYWMTDSRGMLQFSKISDPDQSSGYTLDDNARALIAVCMHHRMVKTDRAKGLNLIRIYLKFIGDCQCSDGSFLNYVNAEGAFDEQNHYINLEDSNGRAMWALGTLISESDHLPRSVVKRADQIFTKGLSHISSVTSPRAIAFAMKGLYYYQYQKAHRDVTELMSKLADRLMFYYDCSSDHDWQWFEPSMTYANAVLPEALLYAYLTTGKPIYRRTARLCFDFLLSKTFDSRAIRVISNRGWMHQNGPIASQFGQQPIDVTYTILALDLFWKVFGHSEYRRKMDIAFEWFFGRNHLSQMMYNPTTAGCFDGLEETNVNLNQGAESTVCYLLARLTMESFKKPELHGYRSLKAEGIIIQ